MKNQQLIDVAADYSPLEYVDLLCRLRKEFAGFQDSGQQACHVRLSARDLEVFKDVAEVRRLASTGPERQIEHVFLGIRVDVTRSYGNTSIRPVPQPAPDPVPAQ